MVLNLALYENSGATISTTEFSLVNASTSIAAVTTDAVVQVWIDFVNMVAGDEYEVAVQEKIYAAGSQKRRVIANLVGAQPEFFFADLGLLGNGWDVTCKRIAGADRSVSWSIRAVT